MFEIKAQGSVSGRFYKVILIAESHFTFFIDEKCLLAKLTVLAKQITLVVKSREAKNKPGAAMTVPGEAKPLTEWVITDY